MINLLNYFRSYRFCLNTELSPAYLNIDTHLTTLGWQKTSKKKQAHFDEGHFLFNTYAAECLEFKHLLANLIAQFCPEIMPLTYSIDDQNWSSVLNKISKDNQVWILKPSTLNNGQYIKIFNQLHQIEEHFLSKNRMGGTHVLQQYILYPHLLKGPSAGHKYSIRMFMVATNDAGIYLYPHGYFNIAVHPYQMHVFHDTRSHLTNEHLTKNVKNVIQVPTQQYALFKPFYPQIKNILTKLISSWKSSYPLAFQNSSKRTLAIFGMDFMVDANERVWLLEANHGPCFPIQEEHPLQTPLYHDFWQAFVNSFVIPIAKNAGNEHTEYVLFEMI